MRALADCLLSALSPQTSMVTLVPHCCDRFSRRLRPTVHAERGLSVSERVSRGKRRLPVVATVAVALLWTTTQSSAARAQESLPVSPPEAIIRVPAEYPPEAVRNARIVTSALFVTVEADGSVSDVQVAESAGDAFDAAAVTAARQWRFLPARRGDVAVRARIRVPFEFSALTVTPPSAPHPPAVSAEASAQITVNGNRPTRSESRSASDFRIARDVLEAAPRREGADVLRTAPGLYVDRPEGLAVGHRYMLRGFDAEHGQDIEFRVGGIPINVPSHIHGQGYADLGFLVAEAVDEVHATEGVYDPIQGDFAVAGSLNIRLAVPRRGVQLRSSYGSFDTFRQLLLWAPGDEEPGTFGAVQYTRTDGYGSNRRGQAASAIVQSVFGGGNWHYRALGILYGARANLAGVIRTDDLAAGRVGFYDVYPYATARAQNAFAARLIAGVFADYAGQRGESAEVGAWAGVDDFRLQENFTGFLQRSQTLENVAGRGDLIEQQNRTRSLGISARYRTAPYEFSSAVHGTVELGTSGRLDETTQAQNLLDASVRNQTWDHRVDAEILGASLGFWADVDCHVARVLRLRVGFRADALYYDVEDRLGNFAPLTRPQDSFIVGFRRSAMGVAWGPRTSVELRPLRPLSIRAAYGEGYRSPQARLLADGEEAPFTKVRSADLGARWSPRDRVALTVAGYFTHLSDDVAFDAEEGRLERIGQTRRMGAVLHAQARPFEWMTAALSLTYVDAELMEPPPASANEPEPPFRAGQNLPFVPPVVVRLDWGAKPTLREAMGAHDLVGTTGLGFSFISSRPLPYGDFADPIASLDASAGALWGPLDLRLDVFNVFDARYSASEFNFASSWEPDAARPRTPARHFAAGAPRTWLCTLGVSL